MTAAAQDILHFWFEELSDKQRFAKDPVLDARMRQRFGATLAAAAAGELSTWRATPVERLAEIIVLDQFSRNIYRDTPAAFAQDAQALTLAQEMVAGGHDQALTVPQRGWAYMPYMHSESLQVHDQVLPLFSQPGLEGTLAFELRHRAILEKFGRYPHRNAVLARPSSPQEQAFLEQPGSAF